MKILHTLKGINDGKVIVYQFASAIYAKYQDRFHFTYLDSRDIHNPQGTLNEALTYCKKYIDPTIIKTN